MGSAFQALIFFFEQLVGIALGVLKSVLVLLDHNRVC